MLSLSLLNQGWGVPKHYLVETQDYDNNTVGTQKDDNYVVGTQDDDNYVVGIHDNLARTDQDVFDEYGRIQLEHIFCSGCPAILFTLFFSEYLGS